MEHDPGFQVDQCYYDVIGSPTCNHPLLCGEDSESILVCDRCCREMNDNGESYYWSHRMDHSGKESQKNNCLYKKHGYSATVCGDCTDDEKFVAAGYNLCESDHGRLLRLMCTHM